MKYISFAVSMLCWLSSVAFTGCRKQEQCAAGDTPAVCKEVQKCFAVRYFGRSLPRRRERREAKRVRTIPPLAVALRMA